MVTTKLPYVPSTPRSTINETALRAHPRALADKWTALIIGILAQSERRRLTNCAA